MSAIFKWLFDPTNLTAISTLTIAAFTGALIAVGWCQAHLTRKTIDLARDEFIATHRPRVVLKEIRDTKPGSFADGKKAYIEIVLANAGESLATVSEWDARLYFRNNKAALTPFFNRPVAKVTGLSTESAK